MLAPVFIYTSIYNDAAIIQYSRDVIVVRLGHDHGNFYTAVCIVARLLYRQQLQQQQWQWQQPQHHCVYLEIIIGLPACLPACLPVCLSTGPWLHSASSKREHGKGMKLQEKIQI